MSYDVYNNKIKKLSFCFFLNKKTIGLREGPFVLAQATPHLHAKSSGIK